VDFLRLMPQKISDYRAARTFDPNGVCRVKNRPIGDFLGVLRTKRNKLLVSVYKAAGLSGKSIKDKF
jgi:hypothetical protein